MKSTADDRERGRALTDLGATLLIEASAGTGKTSLLAGRVAMLLAAGRSPSSIAAITFTERAAAELRARVDKFAGMLVNGVIPKDLEPAFRRRPLGGQQAEALLSTRPRLGEITASTPALSITAILPLHCPFSIGSGNSKFFLTIGAHHFSCMSSITFMARYNN